MTIDYVTIPTNHCNLLLLTQPLGTEQFCLWIYFLYDGEQGKNL